MPRSAGLFRRQAVVASEDGAKQGAPVCLIPTWTNGVYWFLVALVLGGITYAVLASVGEFAQGPAIVRVEGRVDLTTELGGVVVGVEVLPGMEVQAGQVLVRFNAENQRQELEQVEREFELKLVRLLLHPEDQGMRQALSALRASREHAEARLRQRAVRAPRPGVVRNLRIRPGQLLSSGDPVLTLVDERSTAYGVVALVPGQFRPLLRPGLRMQFALDGFNRKPEELVVEAVGDEAVGPAEARRYLGREIGDTVAVQGSLVLVRARLPSRTFAHDGESYTYYDGIPGRVQIEVKTLRLAAMLFPSLRELFPHGR